MFQWIVLVISAVVCVNSQASDNLTSLSEDGINEWEPKIFLDKTIYSIAEHRGHLALKALSNKSASGLMLKRKIDLMATPYLSWSWLIENKLSPLDERTKNGDDFVARIYVVIDGGLLFWQTLSLNYVWSSNQNKGLVWNNPFAGSNVKMMSVRGLQSKKGFWYEEKRHVYNDLIEVFGDKGSKEANQKAYRYIDIVAIMTDTDNSGKKAETYYGDILFSRE